VTLLRWLQTFPSYGFVFSVRPANEAAVQSHFMSQGIECATVGEVTESPEVWLRDGDARALLWDVSSQPFITARAGIALEAAHA
jgi:selenophosphate synthetase-related protein